MAALVSPVVKWSSPGDQVQSSNCTYPVCCFWYRIWLLCK